MLTEAEMDMPFESQIYPFMWYEDHYKQAYSISLGITIFPPGDDYKSELFKSRWGFIGTGGDWESLAKVFIRKNMPEIKDMIDFDSERIMFCAYSQDEESIKRFITEFKKACDDDKAIKKLFKRAIPANPFLWILMKLIGFKFLAL